MQTQDYVSASELGEYVYCKRAWWMRFKGYSKENSRMLEGTASHNSLNNFLERLSFFKLVAVSLILIGLAGLLFLLFK